MSTRREEIYKILEEIRQIDAFRPGEGIARATPSALTGAIAPSPGMRDLGQRGEFTRPVTPAAPTPTPTSGTDFREEVSRNQEAYRRRMEEQARERSWREARERMMEQLQVYMRQLPPEERAEIEEMVPEAAQSISYDAVSTLLNLPVTRPHGKQRLLARGWAGERAGQPYGEAMEYNPGVDFAMPEGTPVPTPAPGKVTFAQSIRGYGHTVMVETADGIMFVYAGLSDYDVTAGDTVQAGQSIGKAGNSGTMLFQPGVHFEVRQGEEAREIDPLQWLQGLAGGAF